MDILILVYCGTRSRRYVRHDRLMVKQLWGFRERLLKLRDDTDAVKISCMPSAPDTDPPVATIAQLTVSHFPNTAAISTPW